jgi:nickel transport protein
VGFECRDKIQILGGLKMRKILFTVFTVMIVFFLTSSAFAHHVWVEKEGDRFFIGWGHYPKMDTYEPKQVKDIKAFDLKGRELALTRTDGKDRVYLSSNADVSVITLSFESGYWLRTLEGWKKMTKSDAQKAGVHFVESIYSKHFGKSIFSYSDAVMRPAGMMFEIVPLENPFSLKQGDMLSVKVLYQGKALAGATVEIGDHIEVGKTDEKGIASIKIPEGKKQVVMARYRIAYDGTDADTMSFRTAFTWAGHGHGYGRQNETTY